MSNQRSKPQIQYSVVCGGCDRETYMYEQYCHRCGHDRWEGK